MSTVTQFLFETARTLGAAFQALILPGLFFMALGFLVKGRQLYADMRRAAREGKLNLTILALNTLLVVPLIGIMSQAVSDVFGAGSAVLIEQSSWRGIPAVLTIFAAVFIGDFTGYWRHRLEHTTFLWPSHAIHHSDTEMTWLAIERFHPINRLTTFLIDSTVLLVLGFPPYAVLANNLIRHYYGAFIHADLPWTYGIFGRIFVSPAMHRWHHSADHRYFDTNYATVFSLFDRVFGTYKVPGPCTARLGVTDAIQPTLTSQMLYPFSPKPYQRLLRHKRRAQ